MTLYVAGVVKRLTRRIVAPLCVGSSPTTRPIFFYPKSGKGMKKFTGSFIWGYRQAVRQRTLTPLSVVRLHLPLPVHGSCSSPLQDFLRGNKSLSRPVVSAPFGGWRHHLARWEACHWIRGSRASPMNPVPLPPQGETRSMERKNRESYISCTIPQFSPLVVNAVSQSPAGVSCHMTHKANPVTLTL